MTELEQHRQHLQNPNTQMDDEIDLRELFSAIWQGKWLIMVVTFVFAVGSVFYALSLPDIYKSEALLAPASDNSGMKVPGQLGGLAALAGVSFGGGGGDKTALAIEVLKSRDFIGRFIEKYGLFVPVMAAEGWNRSDNSLKINPELYNIENKAWVREVVAPFKPKPSILETYAKFKEMLTVSQDKSTSMVTLSFEHFSPFLAQEWVSLLVKEVNEEMRRRELEEAERSITYLTNQINTTDIADVQTMLFSLVEEQTKTVMLANVRSEYVFKIIDPAVVAEKKSGPKRALICILAIMLGGLLSVIWVLIHYFSSKK